MRAVGTDSGSYCTSCYTGVYPVAFPRDEQAYLQLALKSRRLIGFAMLVSSAPARALSGGASAVLAPLPQRRTTRRRAGAAWRELPPS